VHLFRNCATNSLTTYRDSANIGNAVSFWSDQPADSEPVDNGGQCCCRPTSEPKHRTALVEVSVYVSIDVPRLDRIGLDGDFTPGGMPWTERWEAE